MNSPFRRILPALLLALVTAAARAQDAPAPLTIDFQSAEPGPPPDDVMSTEADAAFSIAAEGENKFLELGPQPLVDAGMLVGKSIKGGVSVKAKIQAESKRRSAPRFGVGLHGVGGFRLRAAPAGKTIEIVKDDEVLASAPLEWKSGSWTWLEFSVTPADGGSLIEGRVWENGQPRPEKALVTTKATTPPGQGKASVWGGPYAGLPIRFDDITVTPAP